jgi:hypothetical protein
VLEILTQHITLSVVLEERHQVPTHNTLFTTLEQIPSAIENSVLTKKQLKTAEHS